MVAFLAVMSIGAIPVPINPKIGIDSLAVILKDSRPRAVFIEKDEIDRISEKLIDFQHLINNNIFIQDIFLPHKTTHHFTSLLPIWQQKQLQKPFEYYLKKPESVAFWQYTSGTTGFPKAVMHTQEVMIFNTEQFAKNTLAIGNKDIILSVPKMFFGYGLGNSLFFPLLTGGTVILEAGWFDIETLIENIDYHTPTVLFAVPKVYSLLLKRASTIRLFYSAGSHLPKGLNERWEQHFGKPILDGIGSTEIGHVFISNTLENPLVGKTGFPVEGYDVKICDAHENLVNPQEVGELWVKPTYHLLGYWENNTATLQKYTNGWYRSGDLFLQNIDQSYSYVGRADDLFKVNGRWIAPLEIEQFILTKFELVEDAALIGVHDEEGHEIPVMYLQTTFDDEWLKEKIHQQLINQFESYKIPVTYIQVRDFPKNENGKLLRKKLALSYQEKTSKI
jgi:acyl-coenzyme A synthetase/AMP-(fatty) acid ligase